MVSWYTESTSRSPLRTSRKEQYLVPTVLFSVVVHTLAVITVIIIVDVINKLYNCTGLYTLVRKSSVNNSEQYILESIIRTGSNRTNFGQH